MKRVALRILRSIKNKKLYVFSFNVLSLLVNGKFSAKSERDNKVSYAGYHIPHCNRLTFYIYGLDRRAKNISLDYAIKKVGLEPRDTIIDCGANCGDLRLALRARNVESLNYIAFEPGKPEYACLEANTSCFPSISSDLRRLALSNKAGTMKFFESPEHGDGSLLEIANFSNVDEVEVDTLDIQVASVDKIKLLKLEAEDFEPEILQGAAETLKKTAYISVDVGFDRGLREESTLPEVVNLLLKSGFEVTANSKQRMTILFRNTNLGL